MKQWRAIIRKENVKPTWRFPGLTRSSMMIDRNVENAEGGSNSELPRGELHCKIGTVISRIALQTPCGWEIREMKDYAGPR